MQSFRFEPFARSDSSRFVSTLLFFLLFTFAALPASAQVTGLVREASTLLPVEGALVSLQATSTRTTTAADGTFTLPGVAGTDLVVVGASKGYFNRSVTVSAPTTGVLITLVPVPQEDDPAYTLSDPADCGTCHPDQEAQWTGSPMAKAGINTWVHDIFDGSGTAGGLGGFVYLRDSEFALSNPESECASCHQPQYWVENPFSALEPKESLEPGVVHGVSCDICHKIADIDISQPNYPGIFPGIVTLTRPNGPAFEQVQYGVLGDTNYSNPTEMRASYQPQLVAETCAACHQDKNDPDEDGEFEEANGVISEPTYIEWVESLYGDEESPLYATCVDCHMPAFGGTEVCDVLAPPLLRDPDTVRSHEIRGTTPEYLENAVAVTVNAELNGTTLEVDVALKNNGTGHHVPTGVTVRNMILLVEAWRESDSMELVSTGAQTIHDLGGIGDPAFGYYAGLPGKFFAKVNHNGMGVGPTFFTDATGIQFDNRIPALETDNTSYSFDVPAGGGILHVSARVIYRRAFRFLVDAKAWTVDGHGNPLEDVIGPDFGHLMASASRTVISVSCVGQASGTPCSDGNPCNGDETCDGADVCQPGTPVVCSDGDACNGEETCDPDTGACTAGDAPVCYDGIACTADLCIAALGCTFPSACDDGNPCTQDICGGESGCANVEEPLTGCLVAERAQLAIIDNGDDSKDKLSWKWKKGEFVDQIDLGSPATTSTYALCVYDNAAAVSSAAAGLEIAPSANWQDKNPKGWVYKDKSGTSSGVLKALLKTGTAGKSSAQVKAKGVAIPMPTAATPFAMFSIDPTVTVQLSSDDGPACWTSSFTAADVKRNKADLFKGKVQ